MADRGAYEAMAGRARVRFEELLNWDATAAGIVRGEGFGGFGEGVEVTATAKAKAKCGGSSLRSE